MHNAAHKEDRDFYRDNSYFHKNRNVSISPEEKIKIFKTKIADENYLDHAIQKIATDLTHFLTK